MKIKPDFEIINVADDYMLVPVGDQMEQFSGTVVINEVSAFLLGLMKTDISEEGLVNALISEYDVDEDTARADVDKTLKKMIEIGIIYE